MAALQSTVPSSRLSAFHHLSPFRTARDPGPKAAQALTGGNAAQLQTPHLLRCATFRAIMIAGVRGW